MAHALRFNVRSLVTVAVVALLVASADSRQPASIRVAANGDLQAALDRARAGDTILLAAGARFTGSFVLPVHDGTTYITVRSDADGLPGPGVRTSPRHAGRLAVIASATNEPALRTAPGTHHWRIENVAFGPNRDGEGHIIALGEGAPAQSRASDVPYALVLDRVLVRGDPDLGQRRGVALNSAATEIRNSHISDIKATGVDTQAIGGWNGPGPFTIENNYLEASSENIMFGGGDPGIEGLIPTDITIRGNHITRPVAWRDPIVPPPSAVRAAARLGGGVSAGTYVYKIVAERPAGRRETARSAPASGMEIAVGDGGHAVTVDWTPVDGAQGYRVYRTAGGKDTVYWRVNAPPFVDTGAAGTAGAPPQRGTVWQVKNLLELKSGRNVRIDGNLFEHHWPGAQSGYALLFKPVNQGGRAPWTTVDGVEFTNNVVRAVSGGVNINGSDPERPSERAGSILVRNNLFVIDRKAWGGPGDFVQIGSGPRQVVVERNTVVHDGRVLSLYKGKTTGEIDRLVFRGNVLRHNQYGVKGEGAAVGGPSLERYGPGAVFADNVVAGGDRGRYPEGNHFVAEAEFDGLFVNPSASDFRIRREGRPYASAGVDWAALSGAFSASTTARDAPAGRPRSRD